MKLIKKPILFLFAFFSITQVKAEQVEDLQEKPVTERVKNLLLQKNIRADQLEQSYVWKTKKFTISQALSSFVFGTVLVVVSVGCFTAPLWGKTTEFWQNIALMFVGFIPLAIALLIFSMTKMSYHESLHPGCFCLTSEELVIIPNGAGTEVVLIPYKDIVFFKRYSTDPDSSVEQLVAAQQRKNKLSYALEDREDWLNVLQELNQEKSEDFEEEGSSEIWLVYKLNNNKPKLNTYCSSDVFESPARYKEFYEELLERL